MKYYLFAGSIFYAAGGARDFIKSSDDLEFLLEYARELIDSEEADHWDLYEWCHIVDEDMNIIHKDGEAHS